MLEAVREHGCPPQILHLARIVRRLCFYCMSVYNFCLVQFFSFLVCDCLSGTRNCLLIFFHVLFKSSLIRGLQVPYDIILSCRL